MSVPAVIDEEFDTWMTMERRSFAERVDPERAESGFHETENVLMPVPVTIVGKVVLATGEPAVLRRWNTGRKVTVDAQTVTSMLDE